MTYRDPELSWIASELQQEKNKTAILQEENKDLRALLKKEAEEIYIPDPPPNISGFRKLICWFGSHTWDIDIIDEKVKEMLPVWKNPNEPFNRVIFNDYVEVFCTHCKHKVWTNGKMDQNQSLGDAIRICSMVEHVYQEFLAEFNDITSNDKDE